MSSMKNNFFTHSRNIAFLASWRGVVSILDRGLRRGLFNEVIYEQRPEGSEGVSLVKIWKKRIPGKENSRCKGPEGSTFYKVEKVNMAGAQQSEQGGR